MTSDPADEGRRDRATAGRAAAARVLVAVDEGEHADRALARETEGAPRDVRGAAWSLALGVLRGRGRVDAALAGVLDRSLEDVQPAVRAALRLGVWEKLLGGTAAFAAVDQAVEVVRALGVGRAAGFVNAVVRRAELPDSFDRAAWLDQPAWLVERWDDRYGTDATEAWCLRGRSTPPLFVVARDAAAERSLLELEGARGAGVDRVVRLPCAPGPIPLIPGFLEGRFWVQDLGSVLMADLLLSAVGPGPLLDACAAPGGKTLRLAASGRRVRAVDRAPRLGRLWGAVRRCGVTDTVEVHAHDWRVGPLADRSRYAGVLVDAPCSGLGTWRRRPDVRWRRTPEDLEEVSSLQALILAEAAAHVAPGGVLVYGVCSPEPEEGERVVDAFLAGDHAFSVDAVLHTAPGIHDEDAFHAVRLRREAP